MMNDIFNIRLSPVHRRTGLSAEQIISIAIRSKHDVNSPITSVVNDILKAAELLKNENESIKELESAKDTK